MTRGTSNGNARGSTEDRRRRRAWIMDVWASDVPGLVRCFRCGGLLYDPGAPVPAGLDWRRHYPEAAGVMYLWTRDAHGGLDLVAVHALTVDRIVPGCKGGTYRRNNIRPACGPCNSEVGGGTRA